MLSSRPFECPPALLAMAREKPAVVTAVVRVFVAEGDLVVEELADDADGDGAVDGDTR